MPTIRAFSACKICMYADDHNPPHFHVLAADFHVKVEISTLRIIAGEVRKRTLREPLAWAAKNKAKLALKWIELNSRG